MSADEKIREKVREFLNKRSPGLGPKDFRKAEDALVKLVKETVRETLELDQVKDMEDEGEEFDLLISLSVLSNGRQITIETFELEE